MKKVAIMQPYFFPYIGYWQLINSVDEFVVYDNIQFTKKGWFNRNRILDGDHDRLFTIPIKKDSDYLNVDERYLSDDSQKEITRNLRIIETTYHKAPYFVEAYPIIESSFKYDEKNLFAYINNSIKTICTHLDIETIITISSSVDINHSLKADQKVIAIAKATGADMYINAIGGVELYDKDLFKTHELDLKFIKSKAVEYEQFDKPFVPWLSIIDVLMFNDKKKIREMLEQYELL